MGEGAAVVGDHPPDGAVDVGIVGGVQEGAELRVLRLQRTGRRLPAQQLLVLSAELSDLALQRLVGIELGQRVAQRCDRFRHKRERRGDHVVDVDAQPLDQTAVGLADQHQSDGRGDEQPERKALGPPFEWIGDFYKCPFAPFHEAPSERQLKTPKSPRRPYRSSQQDMGFYVVT
ncbi:MAG: hypothetical protein P8X61_06675 [Limibacillus sp.]